jgi:hypothetical protein
MPREDEMPAPDEHDLFSLWVLSALGIDMRPPAGNQGSQEKAADGMAVWKAARAKAVADLHGVAKKVDKLDFPQAPKAVMLLRGIAANLTEEPRTAQQVQELRSFLQNDDNIEEAEQPNGFGIEIALREPLLAALDGLQPAQ